MKTLAQQLSVLLLVFSCSLPPLKNNADIRFKVQEHDYGKIPLKEEIEYRFEFSNPGKTPLVINDVKTSCGCTIPEWPKKPVKPGNKGEIKVKYDATFPGAFNKTITVYFNGKGSPVRLSIKGQVGHPAKKKMNEGKKVG